MDNNPSCKQSQGTLHSVSARHTRSPADQPSPSTTAPAHLVKVLLQDPAHTIPGRAWQLTGAWGSLCSSLHCSSHLVSTIDLLTAHQLLGGGVHSPTGTVLFLLILSALCFLIFTFDHLSSLIVTCLDRGTAQAGGRHSPGLHCTHHCHHLPPAPPDQQSGRAGGAAGVGGLLP